MSSKENEHPFWVWIRRWAHEFRIAGLQSRPVLEMVRYARPCTIRRAKPADYAAMEALHDSLSGNLVPYGYGRLFATSIRDKANVYFVGEHEGRLVCLGGVSPPKGVSSLGTLCFGLVHPDFQRQGFGTTMLLARVALLGLGPLYTTHVCVSATEYSTPWFERMEVTWLCGNKDPNGHKMHFGYFLTGDREASYLRGKLAKLGVSLPKVTYWPTDFEEPVKGIHEVLLEQDAMVERLPALPHHSS